MDAGQSPLNFDELYFVWSRKQSLRLLDREGPALVLAGSGFCDAGPILLQDHFHPEVKDTLLRFRNIWVRPLETK